MEAADALYGVTMAPGGSSKVVSQKVPRDRVGPDLGVDEAAGRPGEAGDTAVELTGWRRTSEGRGRGRWFPSAGGAGAGVRVGRGPAVDRSGGRSDRARGDRRPRSGARARRDLRGPGADGPAGDRPSPVLTTDPGSFRHPTSNSSRHPMSKFVPAPHVAPVPVPDTGFSPEFVAELAADEAAPEHAGQQPSEYPSATHEPEPEPGDCGTGRLGTGRSDRPTPIRRTSSGSRTPSTTSRTPKVSLPTSAGPSPTRGTEPDGGTAPAPEPGPRSEPGIGSTGWQPRVVRPERVGGSES